MKLSVYSLKKILFQGEAKAVNCKTSNGEITILDNHRPLISSLREGIIKVIDKNEKEYYIPVSSGFLEIGGGLARFIVEEETTKTQNV